MECHALKFSCEHGSLHTGVYGAKLHCTEMPELTLYPLAVNLEAECP